MIIAKTSPMGPVHLAFPMDLLSDQISEQLPAALAHARACMGPVLIDLKSDPKKIEYYVSYMSR